MHETRTQSHTKSYVRADRRGGMSKRPMQSGQLDMIVLFLRIAPYQGRGVSNEMEYCVKINSWQCVIVFVSRDVK